MARTINVPVDLLSDPKTASVSPSARRLLVTSWAICDDKGNVAATLLDQAQARWGEAIRDEERVELPEILADLEKLGFLRDLKKKRDVFPFKRSGAWLS
jgi:hypothetical protein